VSAFPVLRHRADFDAISRRGATRSGRLLVLRSLRTDGQVTRIGISTPRRLGGAVERNRVRRRLRELLRERYDGMAAGWDLLIIAKPAAVPATFAELRAELGSLLTRSTITS
jgi:ribonuclease P protein component